MLSQVATLCAGKLVGEDCSFERISIDTRTLQPGDLFIAIRGDRFDGHGFSGQAIAAGARAALVERAVDGFAGYVQVDNCREAFGKVASALVSGCTARRLAVTGNAGKTTVKEMIACMLGDDVHATRGNFNNDIGVPLTLLQLKPEHRFGVFELGANAPGEIAWTASLVKPEVAMVTNVTGAHLEGFGSMQGIANAKAEIFSGVAAGGVAVINQDDSFAEFFAASAERAGLRVLRVSASALADLYASDIEDTGSSVQFTLHCAAGEQSVVVPLPGQHQVINALMALAAVTTVGVSLEQAIARLAGMQPVSGRMNMHAFGGGTLVDDTYNANPGSVRAAIDWLSRRNGKRLLVLGGLAELGESAAEIQQQLGRDAAAAGIDLLLAVGDAAGNAAAGFGEGALQVADHSAAVPMVMGVLAEGGTVLVKGSRSAAMEKVVQQAMETVVAQGQSHGEQN